MDTSWFTGAWIAQAAVAASIGAAVGYIPAHLIAEKSSDELKAMGDRLAAEQDRLRQITNTLARALEDTEVVGPFRRTPDSDLMGITSSLKATVAGSSGASVTELSSTNSESVPGSKNS